MDLFHLASFLKQQKYVTVNKPDFFLRKMTIHVCWNDQFNKQNLNLSNMEITLNIFPIT